MTTATPKDSSRPLLWALIALGALVCYHTATRLSVSALDLRFLLLAVATVGIGSRLSVKIPRTKSEITVSETFIFLTLLLFGGEAAILLGVVEAFCTSLRLTKRRVYQFFNAGSIACSYFLTVSALRLCFGPVENLMEGALSASLVLAICLIASVQYVTNSGLIATCIALRNGDSIWQTWRQNFLYSSVTYFAGAAAAVLIAKLISAVGFYVVVATVPVIVIVYFTYYFYLKNVEAKTAQVEQAQRHVEELSLHISEQERIREALQESEEHFRNAFDYASIGMALVAPDGRWLQVNRSMCEIVGYGEEELLETKFQAITHPGDLGAFLGHVRQLFDGVLPAFQLEKRYFHKNGHEVWVLLSVSLVRQADGNSRHLIFQIQDITDRRRAEERLLHDAFHDGLTGLPNRALFIDHLKLAIERTRRNPALMFAVLFLDLDRFKVINDSLGHMNGDQLLIVIARRLENCLRPGDTVARLGGDEFTILLDDIRDESEATDVAERIKDELRQSINVNGHEVFTTVSVGIAPSTIGYDRPEDMLRDADTAMYRAKSRGKMRHEVFVDSMHSNAVSLLQLETDLRRAVEREEFVVHYQPIVSLATGALEGFEALVRWQHPERGLVSPDEFIPVAEETGIIVPLGRHVLREACSQMRAWQKLCPAVPALTMSVNLSSKQFMQSDLVDQIKEVLDGVGLKPQCLKLEITESVVMENFETATEMLRQLRALGVQLSIDDFGTGYSSLSYLHRFPIDTLKIDRSFVTQMTDNVENKEIVRTILMLARNLGMSVVAEGVETEEQLSELVALDCGHGQGYLFSRAVDADTALGMIRTQPHWIAGAAHALVEKEISEEYATLGSSLLM